MPPKNARKKAFHCYETRLETFSSARLKGSKPRSRKVSWPHATPSASQVAKCGFYFTPEPSVSGADSVTCYMCDCKIGGWEPEDDPIKVHFESYKDCPLAILLSKPWEILDENGNLVSIDSEHNPFNETSMLVRLQTFFHPLKDSDSEDAFLSLATETSSILSSFLSVASPLWPYDSKKGWKPTSINMAKAGFFYSPHADGEDSCVCPYCNLCLDGWEPSDDPVLEHERRSPGCYFFTSSFRSKTQPIYDQINIPINSHNDSHSKVNTKNNTHIPESDGYDSTSSISSVSSTKSSTVKKPRKKRVSKKRSSALVTDSESEEAPKPKRRGRPPKKSSQIPTLNSSKPTTNSGLTAKRSSTSIPSDKLAGSEEAKPHYETSQLESTTTTSSTSKLRLSSLDFEDSSNLFKRIPPKDSQNNGEVFSSKSQTLQPAVSFNGRERSGSQSRNFSSNSTSTYDPMASSSGVRVTHVGSVSEKISRFEDLAPSSPTTPRSPASSRHVLSPRFSSNSLKYVSALAAANKSKIKQETPSQSAFELALNRSQSLKDSFTKASTATSYLFNRSSTIHGNNPSTNIQNKESHHVFLSDSPQKEVKIKKESFSPLPTIPSVSNISDIVDLLSPEKSRDTPLLPALPSSSHYSSKSPIGRSTSNYETSGTAKRVDQSPLRSPLAMKPLSPTDDTKLKMLERGLSVSLDKDDQDNANQEKIGKPKQLHNKPIQKEVNLSFSSDSQNSDVESRNKNSKKESAFSLLDVGISNSSLGVKKLTLSPSEIYHDPESSISNDESLKNKENTHSSSHDTENNSRTSDSILSDTENLPLPPRIHGSGGGSENWSRLSDASSIQSSDSRNSLASPGQILRPSSPSQRNTVSPSPPPSISSDKKRGSAFATSKKNKTAADFEDSSNTIHRSPGFVDPNSKHYSGSGENSNSLHSTNTQTQIATPRHLQHLISKSSPLTSVIANSLKNLNNGKLDSKADSSFENNQFRTNSRTILRESIGSLEDSEKESSKGSGTEIFVDKIMKDLDADIDGDADIEDLNDEYEKVQNILSPSNRNINGTSGIHKPSMNIRTPERQSSDSPLAFVASAADRTGSKNSISSPSSIRKQHHIRKHPHFPVSVTTTPSEKSLSGNKWIPADIDCVFEVLNGLDSESEFDVTGSGRKQKRGWIERNNLLDKTVKECIDFMALQGESKLKAKCETLITTIEKEAQRALKSLEALPVID